MLTNEDTLKVFKTLLSKLRFGSEEREAVNNAIVLLEKNKPKEPYYWGKISKYECPICDKPVFNNMRYCSYCGQKLDWDFY